MDTNPWQQTNGDVPLLGIRFSKKWDIIRYRISCSTIAKLNTSATIVPEAGLEYSGIRNS